MIRRPSVEPPVGAASLRASAAPAHAPPSRCLPATCRPDVTRGSGQTGLAGKAAHGRQGAVGGLRVSACVHDPGARLPVLLCPLLGPGSGARSPRGRPASRPAACTSRQPVGLLGLAEALGSSRGREADLGHPDVLVAVPVDRDMIALMWAINAASLSSTRGIERCQNAGKGWKAIPSVSSAAPRL